MSTTIRSTITSLGIIMNDDETRIRNKMKTYFDFDIGQLGILIACLISMGAALGFERSLLPRMAVEVWGITSSTTVLNLVSTFGASKAIANVFAGPLADRFGRKPTLVMGFLLGLPVMPFVNCAESWSEITAMNILFGISQGLLGSALFFLLIDVLGPQRRGIAVGLGECTIYVSTAILNVLAGDLASRFGYRPVPFWVATFFAIAGLLATFPLRDTLDQVQAEQQATAATTTQQLATLSSSGEQLSPEEDTIIPSEQIQLNNNPQQKTSAFPDTSDNNSSSTATTNHKDTLTSPTDVRDWRKMEARVRGQSSCSSSNDDDDEDSPQVVNQAYEVYDNKESGLDEDSDDDDPDGAETEYWDQLERSVKRIPLSALQAIGQIPGAMMECAGGSWHHPPSNKDDHTTTTSHKKPTASYTDENTPLMLHPTYERYSRSDSDLESGGSNDMDWDEVEKDVKTLYPSALHVLAHILWTNTNFVILCLAGMTMNFKDGFAWGSFPIFFSQFHHLSDDHTDMLVAIYPLCWGFAQAFTGALSDMYGRKFFLLSGFAACTSATILFFVPGFVWGRPADDNPIHIHIWIIADVLLGLGTAMAYPALQAAVADEIEPVHRGLGLGFYRFVRDMGYVVGALVCGSLTDVLGYPMTFLIVSGVLGSSLLCLWLFYTTNKPPESTATVVSFRVEES